MHDPQKIQEAVLALLGVFQFDQGRCWKSYDWDVMDALHVQGWITNPHSSAKSVYLTPEGQMRAKALAEQWFGASATAVGAGQAGGTQPREQP